MKKILWGGGKFDADIVGKTEHPFEEFGMS